MLLAGLALAAACQAQPPAALPGTPEQQLAAIDPATLTPGARAKREASLNAWQRLGPPPAGRWLLVNIPAFEISLYDGAVRTGRWRAIVGKAKTPTPLFTGTANGVILNPWWEVPASIVAESVGRLVARNPKRAAAQGYVREGNRYRQKPGPANQLGLMKLDFRNPHSVGIHDTPSRQLFMREKRAFSHGCIRVEDPMGFAATLIGPSVSRDSLQAVVDTTHDTRTIPLAAPIPVIVGYFTAEVGAEVQLLLYDDVYQREARQTASVDSGGDCAS